MDFDRLYADLLALVDQGYLKRAVEEETGCELFNYTNKCEIKKHWNELTRMARGLVLHPRSKKILARPFTKFFNHFEQPYQEVGPMTVTEKLDGSLGILFCLEDSRSGPEDSRSGPEDSRSGPEDSRSGPEDSRSGPEDSRSRRWRCVTRGSFNSPQARWGEAWINQHLETGALFPTFTYLFELIYPKNRIIVPYDYSAAVLIGCVDNETGYDFSYEELVPIAERIGARLPERSSFETIDQVIAKARDLPYDDEGYVVRMADGLRLKVKSEAYCMLHRYHQRMTPRGVWELMERGVNLDVCPFNQAQQPAFECYRDQLRSAYQELQAKIELQAQITKDLNDKDLGLKTASGEIDQLVMTKRKNPEWLHGCILKAIRPGFENRRARNRRKRKDWGRRKEPTQRSDLTKRSGEIPQTSTA